jgi:S1-C subfamily serine protease
VIVEKGEKFNQSWPRDHSGLQFAWSVDGDQIEVTYVSPDTPAEDAGFEKGDILTSLNGILVERLDGLIAIRELLKAAPGTRYEFEVERAGQEKKLTLQLEELY